MIITLKMIILGFLFLVSGGSLFGRVFQGKLWLELLAGMVATVSFGYLAKDIIYQMVSQEIQQVKQEMTNPVSAKPVANIAVAEDIKDFEGFKKLAVDNKLLCTVCHQQDKKVIGPSYNAVALMYKDKKDVAATLEEKILVGGTGVWGKAMMTPNPMAKDQVGPMVKWILSLNPEGNAKAKAEAEIEDIKK